MAAKNVDIRINTTADTQGAKQATTAMQGLNTATKQVNQTVNTTTANTGRMGQIAGQAGFQIQDFAVQVGGGTSALTAFSQQAPQLLGIFGPGGAIAGALVAVGAVAAKVFMGMADDAQSASEKAEFMANAIDEIGEAAGKLQSEQTDYGRDAITQAIELAKLLAEGFRQASEQERQFSQQAVEGINRLRIAEIELRKARGEITDEQAAAQQDQAKHDAILATAEQQKKAEQEKVAAAQELAIAQQEELDARAHALTQNQQQLDLEIEKLNALREQKKELEQIAKEGSGGRTQGFSTGQYGPTPRAREAQAALAETPFDAQIKALEARVESLSKSTSGKLYEDLVSSAQALTEAQIAAQQIAAQVTGQVEQIDLKAQEQIIIENTAQMESQAKANADLLRSTFENVQPLNQAQQEGLMLIDRALIDGKLLATEAQDVQKGISLVIANASTNQKINIESVNKLLQLMNSFGATLMNQQKQIDGLQQKYQGIIK
jgi:DNA repair exonuclease SbcCD ATPase subunit